jgi:hypothetical protein
MGWSVFFLSRILRVDSSLLFLHFCTIPPITRWLWILLDEDTSLSFPYPVLSWFFLRTASR